MTHKLIPASGNGFLSPLDAVDRLRKEFVVVNSDPEEGRDVVQAELLHLIKMKDGGMPGCEEHIERLQNLRTDPLQVVLTDDPLSEEAYLRFVIIPDRPILVGYHSGGHQEAAKPLLERCASVLGYQVAWP